MVMLRLLLQRPSTSSKTKDHCEVLSRWLRAWNAGNLCPQTAVHALISEQEVSGEVGRRMHFSMSGSSIPTLPQTTPPPLLPATITMSLYEERIREVECTSFTPLGHGIQHSHWLAAGQTQLQPPMISSDVHPRLTVSSGPRTP